MNTSSSLIINRPPKKQAVSKKKKKTRKTKQNKKAPNDPGVFILNCATREKLNSAYIEVRTAKETKGSEDARTFTILFFPQRRFLNLFPATFLTDRE